MAGRRSNATVCGVPVTVGGPIVDYGGQVRTGTGPYGHRRSISTPGAMRLVDAIFGAGAKPPRRGQTVKLCGDLTLERSAYAKEFYVRKHGAGEMSGRKRRR